METARGGDGWRVSKLHRRYAELAAEVSDAEARLMVAVAAQGLTASDRDELYGWLAAEVASWQGIEYAAVLASRPDAGEEWRVLALAGAAPAELRATGAVDFEAVIPPAGLSTTVPTPDDGWPVTRLLVGSEPAAPEGDLARRIEVASVALGLAVYRRSVEERLSSVASALQRGLMPPRHPRIEGLEFAARLITSEPGVELGGDFYDAFEAAESCWSFAIGDVSGRGVALAATAALARYTLRAAALEDAAPRHVLSVLNEAIHRFRPTEQFLTAAYMTIDPTRRRPEIKIAGVGHPPVLLVRAGGDVEELASRAGLVGVDPDLEPDEGVVESEPGDVIALYTDGVTDAGRNTSNGTSALGLSRLREIIVERRGDDAEAIAAAVEHAVLEIQGGEPEDDAGIVVLKVE